MRWPEFIEKLIAIPWPVSGALAVAAYPVSRVLIDNLQGQTLFQAFVVGIAGVWWFFSAIFCVLAVATLANEAATVRTAGRRKARDELRRLGWGEFIGGLGAALRQEGFVSLDTLEERANREALVLGTGGGERTFLQCRHWQSRLVGAEQVREMLAAMADLELGSGILVTSGEFTGPARRLARRYRIRLLDGKTLQQMVGEPGDGAEEPG